MQKEGRDKENGQRNNEVDGDRFRYGDSDDDAEAEQETELGKSGSPKDDEEESTLDLRTHLRDDILETVSPKKDSRAVSGLRKISFDILIWGKLGAKLHP